MSYGKTWIEADVSSMVVRMPHPTSYYLPGSNTTLLNQAKATFQALPGTGINLSNYDIVGVHFKDIGITSSGGISYAGLATVGGGNQWLQGTASPKVMTHEFGHNYGLNHANFWDAGGSSVVGAGASVEYGNTFDMMGTGAFPNGHFQTRAKQKLAWLGPSDWQPLGVPGAGTYRLYRGDHPDTTGLRAIRIPKHVGLNHYYWLGYRRNDTTNPYLPGSVMMNWDRNGENLLMDTNPGSEAGLSDAPLALGKTYSDSAVNIHVTPVGSGGTSPNEWVDITVNIANTANNSNPTATLTGPSSGEPGTPLSFSVDARDSNGDTLAYHWSFGDGSATANQNAITHTWTVGGEYTVTVTVSDMKGGTVTKTLPITVNDPKLNWTIGNVGTSATMSEATYLNGRYILTGNRYTYFSLDGQNWSRSFLALNFRAGGIAYGNGSYVITGRDYLNSAWRAAAFHSRDGKNWTRSTVPTLGSMEDVAYGNGRFVAVGEDGNSMHSLDGATWVAGGNAGTRTLTAIGFGNGEFLAGGHPSSQPAGKELHASPNGISWSVRSTNGGLENNQFVSDIAFHEGTFFHAGFVGGIRYSTDQGTSWQAATVPESSSYFLHDLHIEAGLYTAIGTSIATGTPVILVSSDGLFWSAISPAGLESSSTLTFGNGVLFSTQGSAGHTQFSDLLFPDNQAPATSISAPTQAVAKTGPVSFTAISTDADSDDLTHIWDFQDGSDLLTGALVEREFDTGGTFEVLLTVVDGRGALTTSTHHITVDSLLTWTTWRSQQFPGNPPNSGAYEDFDHDRVPNLLEFINGTDPKNSNSHQAPTFREESGYLTLTIEKAPGIAGFTLMVEASNNLVDWNTNGLTLVEDNPERLKVRLSTLTAEITGGELYLRGNAELAP